MPAASSVPQLTVSTHFSSGAVTVLVSGDLDVCTMPALLRDAYAAGCLDRGELEQRSQLAYSARTVGELQDLTCDLPASLLVRPVPSRYRCRPPDPALEWRFALLLAIAGPVLIVAATAWTVLAAIPLFLAWMVAFAAWGCVSRRSRAHRRP